MYHPAGLRWGWKHGNILAVTIITSYQFGQVIVNGRNYTPNVIVLLDGVNHDWWRKTGYQLHLNDLSKSMAENPELLVCSFRSSYHLAKSSQPTQ